MTDVTAFIASSVTAAPTSKPSSKLTFKKVRAKNFRSFGNQFIEIDLSAGKTLVCSSDNGAGKSTGLTHALTYGLFDKSYQKGQKKTSLLNSTNNKDCLVEIEFTTPGVEWLVRRGMKPSVFEIVKNGKPVDSEAAKGDHQKYLEEVLGMDDKVFFNTVVLGRDKFVPFNEMTAGDSRNFVEVLLDMGIFTLMNDLTKQDIKDTAAKISDIEYKTGVVTSKELSSKRVIQLLEESAAKKKADNTGVAAGIKLEIDKVKAELISAEALVADNLKVIETAQLKLAEASAILAKEPSDLDTQMQKVRDFYSQFSTKISTLTAAKTKFVSMTVCPTCEQDVSQARKDEVINKTDPEVTKLSEGLEKLKLKQAEIEALIAVRRVKADAVNTANEEVRQARSAMNTKEYAVTSLKSSISALERNLSAVQVISDDTEEQQKIAAEKETLVGIGRELAALNHDEIDSHKKKANQTALLLMLKDDGVKAEIAKKYLPVLNQKVNHFLDKLNLWVNIKIDEEFNIEMFAPDRKGQTIADLSTGQMRRIDLAMLLAWRDVARMKSSVDTNLLVMDETLENLSAQGVADFVEFFENDYASGDVSLFVVSQRQQEFSEYFDNIIEFALKDGFSLVV